MKIIMWSYLGGADNILKKREILRARDLDKTIINLQSN